MREAGWSSSEREQKRIESNSLTGIVESPRARSPPLLLLLISLARDAERARKAAARLATIVKEERREKVRGRS